MGLSFYWRSFEIIAVIIGATTDSAYAERRVRMHASTWSHKAAASVSLVRARHDFVARSGSQAAQRFSDAVVKDISRGWHQRRWTPN